MNRFWQTSKARWASVFIVSALVCCGCTDSRKANEKGKVKSNVNKVANRLVGEWEVSEYIWRLSKPSKEIVQKLRIRFTDRVMINSPSVIIKNRFNMKFDSTKPEERKEMPPTGHIFEFVTDEVGWNVAYQIDPTKTPHEI